MFQGTFSENFRQFQPFWKMVGLPVFWSGAARSGCWVVSFYLPLNEPNDPSPRSIRPPVSELCTFFMNLQGCQFLGLKVARSTLRCLLSLGGPNEYVLKITGDSGSLKNGGFASFFKQGCKVPLRGCQFFPIPSRVPWAILGAHPTCSFRVIEGLWTLQCCQIPKKFLEGFLGSSKGQFLNIWRKSAMLNNGGVASFLEQGCQVRSRGCWFFPFPSRVQ